MINKYDAIIIGGGIGGLTTAAILARRGKKVILFEKNSTLGGYASSFRRNNFEFESAVHLINGCSKGGTIHSILEDLKLNNRIKFVQPKYLYRSIFPDYDIRIPQGNLEEIIDILIKYFPGEVEGLNRLFVTMSKIAYDMANFFECSYLMNQTQKEKNKKNYYYLSNYENKTLKMLLDECLNDDRLKAILSQLWLYLGLPPSKLSSVYFSYIWYDYFKNGGYYPKNGTNLLINAFVDSIRCDKGIIKKNSKIIEILFRNNKIIGVMDEKNQYFFSDIIVSAVDPMQTFFCLIKKQKIYQKIRKEVINMEPSISIFKVYLGVDKKIKKINSEDYEIFVNDSYNLDEQYLGSLNNNSLNSPFSITMFFNLNLGINIQNENKTMSLAMLSGYDYWHDIDNDKYKINKRKLGDTLVGRAEEILPGFSKYIKTIEIATPLTMEKYTNNYKGAAYGWSQILSQSCSRREKLAKNINNIYFSSAWAYPGGGIAGAMYAGKQAAKRISITN